MATGLLLLSVAFPLKVLAKSYDEIYVFGDSFSDTGNVFNATGGAIPPSPYVDGRFSNGSVWVEYLASDLGINFNPQTNFAFGGATTGFDNIGLAGLPGLQQQINSFTTANASVDPNALYIVWASTNDYIKYFFGDVPDPNQTVTNISTAVESLIAVGAKDIMVVNQPDLGKFPITGGNNQTSDALSNLISTHNSNLTASIYLWDQQLNPDINIIGLDVNSLFNRIIADPQEFGFTNATDSCLPGDLSVVPINPPTQPVNCTPDTFVFWDQLHPTTATHKTIGELAFSTLKKEKVPVPEPSPVLGVLTFGALAVVGKRKRKEQSDVVQK
ncbi:GDSL family lipase [Westiellopsis prolifica IICB1]|nr:GDSL family lipase [Westiellopsis prolifica IICB1]